MALNLLEFQRNLLERLQQAGTRSAAASSLGFLAGGQNWLVDLTDIVEVLALPALMPVPLTQPWFRGIANIRGGLYGVVDFSGFCGGKPLVDSPATRLIVLRGGARCALAVERILGICNPEFFKREADSAAGYVAAEYVGDNGSRWKCLDLKELDRDPAFAAVATAQNNHVN